MPPSPSKQCSHKICQLPMPSPVNLNQRQPHQAVPRTRRHPSVFRPSGQTSFPKTPSRFPGKTTLPHPDNPLSRQNIGKKGLPLSGQNLFLRLTHLPDKIPLHHPIPTTAPAKPAPPHTGIPFCRKPSPQPAIFPKYVNRRFSVKIISIYYP